MQDASEGGSIERTWLAGHHARGVMGDAEISVGERTVGRSVGQFGAAVALGRWRLSGSAGVGVGRRLGILWGAVLLRWCAAAAAVALSAGGARASYLGAAVALGRWRLLRRSLSLLRAAIRYRASSCVPGYLPSVCRRSVRSPPVRARRIAPGLLVASPWGEPRNELAPALASVFSRVPPWQSALLTSLRRRSMGSYRLSLPGRAMGVETQVRSSSERTARLTAQSTGRKGFRRRCSVCHHPHAPGPRRGRRAGQAARLGHGWACCCEDDVACGVG